MQSNRGCFLCKIAHPVAVERISHCSIPILLKGEEGGKGRGGGLPVEADPDRQGRQGGQAPGQGVDPCILVQLPHLYLHLLLVLALVPLLDLLYPGLQGLHGHRGLHLRGGQCCFIVLLV